MLSRVMQSLNVSTYLFLGSAAGVCMAFILWAFKGEAVSFGFLSEKPSTLLMVLGTIILPGFGWILSMYAVQNISPAYTAFAEISYPLFTLLFLFLLFGVKHFDGHVLAGGLLIMIGSFVMVYGQIKGISPAR